MFKVLGETESSSGTPSASKYISNHLVLIVFSKILRGGVGEGTVSIRDQEDSQG